MVRNICLESMKEIANPTPLHAHNIFESLIPGYKSLFSSSSGALFVLQVMVSLVLERTSHGTPGMFTLFKVSSGWNKYSVTV